MKELSEITNTLGAKTYSPDEEIARKAPAVICAVASRINRLRGKFRKLKEQVEFNSQFKMSIKELEVFLQDSLTELPFEKELLSGNIIKVDEAIRKI